MSGEGVKPKKPRKKRRAPAAGDPPKKPRDKPLRLSEPLDFDLAISGLMAAASVKPKKRG